MRANAALHGWRTPPTPLSGPLWRFPPSPEPGWSKASGKRARWNSCCRVWTKGPWREELKALRRQAEMGRRYLDGLRQETVRLGLLAEEGLGGETLRAIADRLEEPELEQLRACYARRLEEKLPMPVQLRYDGGETGPEANDGSFVI